jgi:hypothetical protein
MSPEIATRTRSRSRIGSSSTVRGLGNTCHSASVCNAASATDWLNSNCEILWEELLPRYPVVEVMGEPQRVYSNFIHGIQSLPVRIPA